MNVGAKADEATTEVVEKPLKGWKSIAAELGVSESFAKTTARAAGLPVRLVGRSAFAYPSELHAWLRSRPSNVVEPPRPTALRVVAG